MIVIYIFQYKFTFYIRLHGCYIYVFFFIKHALINWLKKTDEIGIPLVEALTLSICTLNKHIYKY